MTSVDVAIPCYNYGRFLRECVESVLGQDIGCLRILIIDNASTDDSAEVAQALARENSCIELLLRTRNLGPTASFNAAIDWCRADYFVILHADDILAPGAVRRALTILEEDPTLSFVLGEELDWVHGSQPPCLERTGGKKLPRFLNVEKFLENRAERLVAGLPVVRTSIQKRAGYFRAELLLADDLEMMLRLSTFGRVALIPEVQNIRRLHGENLEDVYKLDIGKRMQECEEAYRSFFQNEGPGKKGRTIVRRRVMDRIAVRAYWWGVRELYRGHVRVAASLVALALRISPKFIIAPPISYLFRRGGPFSRWNLVSRGSLWRIRVAKP